jgi:protoporphyrinogen oxidase
VDPVTPAPDPVPPAPVLVVGAGPAGLTAAYTLGKRGVRCLVVEADDVVGGISRTVERDGWRFDIGGHRFFTRVPEVKVLWDELLDAEDFPTRPRLSRIFYRGKFFDYPLRPLNALRGLGVFESMLCMGSYLRTRVSPPADRSSLEGWVANAFGWRLYRTFFKTYTEKVWGVPATEIKADWAAQRIRNLSLGRAVLEAMRRSRRRGAKGEQVVSLIEEFRYPRLGPGMMWESAAKKVVGQGSTVLTGTRFERLAMSPSGAVATLRTATGLLEVPVESVISSMPLGELVATLDPPPPPAVREAAAALHHRDFLTVALVVPEERGFPDNWIYIHEPGTQLGRVQNFGSWSPEMVRERSTCLGLEYFVWEGDELWSSPDDELVRRGTRELAALGLVAEGDVEAGYVVRMPKAYPIYDEGYEERVTLIRRYLEEHAPNVHPVGRNGMHRYNNQDHSMMTGMLAAENVLGAEHDTWEVNVDAEYHEEASTDSSRRAVAGRTSGTGRDAPVIPAPVNV